MGEYYHAKGMYSCVCQLVIIIQHSLPAINQNTEADEC